MRHTEMEKAVALPISSKLKIKRDLVLLLFSTRNCLEGAVVFQKKKNPGSRDA